MIKDIWGQEIKNGDFVVSASKSQDDMLMGVMVDVDKKTRIKVEKNFNGKWVASPRPYAMYTLERTLKLPDELIVNCEPELFSIMVGIRQKIKVKTNQSVSSLDVLRKMLQNEAL